MGRGDERVLRMALRNVLRATSHEDALGVCKGCPAADVTEAYRDMAILCHPDKVAAGLRGAAGVAMSRLNAARDVLLSRSRDAAPPPQRLRVVRPATGARQLVADPLGGAAALRNRARVIVSRSESEVLAALCAELGRGGVVAYKC